MLCSSQNIKLRGSLINKRITTNEDSSPEDSSPKNSPPEASSSKEVHEKNQSTETQKIAQQKLRDQTTMKPPRRLIESMLAEVDEPENFSQEINSSNKHHWKKAMEEEMISLRENSTWSLVELPSGCKAISNRWIYRHITLKEK